MKKLFRLLTVAAIVAMTASCATDPTSDSENHVKGNLVPTTITARIAENDTRLSFEFKEGVGSFKWENDDCIAVWDGAEMHEFTINEISEDGKSATFTGQIDEAATQCCALYPSEAWNDYDASTESFNFILPTEQAPELGGVDHSAMICVSKYTQVEPGEGSKVVEFEMTKAFAMVSVDMQQEGFEEFTFKGNNGEYISGNAAFNPSTGSIQAFDKGYISVKPATADKGTYFLTFIPAIFSQGVSIIPKKDGYRTCKYSTDILSTVPGDGMALGRIKGRAWASDTITSKEELDAWAAIAQYAYAGNDSVYLGADIDYGGGQWIWPDVFSGNFEGQNHCITNIKITSSSKELSSTKTNCVGFIGKAYGNVSELTIGATSTNVYDGTSMFTFDSPANGVTNHFGLIGELHAEAYTIANYAPVIVAAVDKNGAEMINSVIQGGIVGYAGKGDIKIINCVNRGKISNNASLTSANDYTPGMGGVLGLAYDETTSFVMDGCSNWGDVVNNCDSSDQEIHVGGVIGFFSDAGTIQNCTNKGTIQNYGDPVNASGYACRLGGVIGSVGNSKPKEFIKCVNEGDVNQCVSPVKASLTMGGVFGSIVGANTTVMGCTNEGNISPLVVCSVNTVVGGVCGYVNKTGIKFTKADDGTHCLNTGTLQNTMSMSWATFGGIVSYVNVSEDTTGNAIIEYCDNEGEIIFGTKDGKGINFTSTLYAGGISARDLRAGSIIRNCTNKGNITPYACIQVAGYMAGIVGQMSGMNTTISDCKNDGTIVFPNKSTTSKDDIYTAGIVCLHKGQILNCENTGRLYTWSADNTPKFGMGGIVSGHSSYNPTLIKGCINRGELGCGKGATGTFIGGIIGYMRPNITKLEDCTNTGYINVSRTNSLKYGGLVGYCPVDKVTEDVVAATNCTLNYDLKVPCSINGGFVVGCLAYPGDYKVQFGTSSEPIYVKGTVQYTTGYDNTYTTGFTILQTTLDNNPTSAGYYKNFLSGFNSPNSEYAYNKTVGSVTISHELNPNFIFNATLLAE